MIHPPEDEFIRAFMISLIAGLALWKAIDIAIWFCGL